jgi:hypothetical protein
MALRAAQHSSWATVGAPLFGWRVLTQNEYTRRKMIYRELVNPPPDASASSAAVVDDISTASTADTARPKAPQHAKKMPMSASPLEPGRLLAVNGIDATLSNAQVRADFESVALVAYIDRHADQPTSAVVRYYTSADRDTAIAKLQGKYPSIRALAGQEETDYLTHAEQQKAKRRAELEQAKLAKEATQDEEKNGAVAKKKRRNKRKTPKSQHVRFGDGANDQDQDHDDDDDDDESDEDQAKKRSTTDA